VEVKNQFHDGLAVCVDALHLYVICVVFE